MTQQDAARKRQPKAAGVYLSRNPDDIWMQGVSEGMDTAVDEMRSEGTLPADFDDKMKALKSKSV